MTIVDIDDDVDVSVIDNVVRSFPNDVTDKKKSLNGEHHRRKDQNGVRDSVAGGEGVAKKDQQVGRRPVDRVVEPHDGDQQVLAVSQRDVCCEAGEQRGFLHVQVHLGAILIKLFLLSLMNSVTRLGKLLHVEQVFKARGNFFCPNGPHFYQFL